METRWIRTVRLGLKSLLLHKLRSGLTALGIIFGVCSVIAMLAIGEGASYQAQQDIQGLGATNIIVRSIKPVQDSSTTTAASRVLEYGLTVQDFERLAKTIPTVTQVLPIRELPKELRSHHRAMDGRVVATTPDYQGINKLRMASGRFLSQADLDRYETVGVLAYEVAQKLFPGEDPVGRGVKVHNEYFRVVGVCEHRDASAAIGGSLAAQEYDKDVYVPFTTARLRFPETQFQARAGQFSFERYQYSQITLALGHLDQVLPTADVVRDLLKRSHTKGDYSVTVPRELLDQAERTKRLFNMVLGSVGAISLLVGGIGIMNIMLATVTERTREIGIRRALGAKRRDITVQFLVETVVLSSTGGLLGLALGVGLSYMVEGSAALLGFPIPGSVPLFGRNVAMRWLVAGAAGTALGLGALAAYVVRVARQGVDVARLVVAGLLCAGAAIAGVVMGAWLGGPTWARPAMGMFAGALVGLVGLGSPAREGFRVVLFGFALCAGGALVGTVIGVGLPYMITDAVSYFFDYTVPTIVNAWSLPLAFSISVGVGVIFGLYPARRAATMDPIEALRHE